MMYYLEHAYHAIEQQIAAIGPVTCDTLSVVGEKIETAERQMDSLMERMGFTQGDAADYVKYYFLIVKNYFVLVDARKEYDRCMEERARGVAVCMMASKDTIAAGERVEVKYRVQNLLDTDTTYSYAITYPILYAALSEKGAALSGSLTLGAGEQAELVFEFTAREGGVLRVGSKLWKAEQELLSDRVMDIQITGAGCYLGTTHSHSTESDGKGTLAQCFYRMIQDGMSLTYAADHNAFVSDKSGLNRALEAIAACGYRFTAVKGTEITVYDNNGHLLSYGNNEDFKEPPRVRTQESIDHWNQLIDTINKAGGYAYLAHPMHEWFNYPGFASDAVSPDKAKEVQFYDDVLELYTEMTGMEIINHHYVGTGANNDRVIAYWDRMNCKGYKKYFGSGGSDGHELKDLSSVYNGFLMDDLTAESLLDAHRNGRLFVTTGPEMRFALGGKTFGQTLFTKETKAKLSVEAYTKTGHLTQVILRDYEIDPSDPEGAYKRGIQTVLYQHQEDDGSAHHLLYEQEIEVRSGHFYRVEVRTSEEERVAFSNPIWVLDAPRQGW